MKAPKYIQLSIKRMLFHRKVVENNTAIVNKWFEANNLNKNMYLKDLLEDNPQKEIVQRGQMSIFDFIKRRLNEIFKDNYRGI